jgi:hypothetical protein
MVERERTRKRRDLLRGGPDEMMPQSPGVKPENASQNGRIYSAQGGEAPAAKQKQVKQP